MKHKIVSILLVVAIFAFNLVLLPAQAEEGCKCDHSHDEEGFVCYCGSSATKPKCDSKGPSISKKHCGLEKSDKDFCIPAHDHPTLLSTEGMDLIPHIALLQAAEIDAVYGPDLLPAEQPPSIL